jgi:signal transduction histidine kinase
LIDNAAEAMKEKDGTGVLRLILEEDDTHIRFTVENNGPEVPRDILPAIFNAGISTKGEGRGMGLSIVQKILEQYGGSIAVTAEDRHTVFTITLPRQKG